MRNRYIIIDDFYKTPGLVRKTFLELGVDSTPGNWAGETSEYCLFDEDMKQYMSTIVGEQIDGATSINGRFRFSKATDPFKQDIHFDPSNGQIWAGVVYMTPNDLVPDLSQAGTTFWRHKTRGIEALPNTIEGLTAQGWYSHDDLRIFLETEGMDRSLWEPTFTIPYKYNRLVLFRPWLFHSPGFAFGDTRETSRMVQTFFLKSKEVTENV